MEVEKAVFYEEKKFMWDGNVYDSEEDAVNKIEEYKNEGFETKKIKKEDKYLVYTRKVVTEVIIEGPPPL